MMRCGRLKAKDGLTSAAARGERRKRSVALVGRFTRGVVRPADFDHSYDAPRPCASLDSCLSSRAVELRDCPNLVWAQLQADLCFERRSSDWIIRSVG